MREEEDLLSITRDWRGSYRRNFFYELYPLIAAIKQKKKSNFKVKDLTLFVNEPFNQLYGSSFNVADENSDKIQLIISEDSIMIDKIMIKTMQIFLN